MDVVDMEAAGQQSSHAVGAVAVGHQPYAVADLRVADVVAAAHLTRKSGLLADPACISVTCD